LTEYQLENVPKYNPLGNGPTDLMDMKYIN